MLFAVPFAASVEELDNAVCDRVVAEVGMPKRRFETRVMLHTSAATRREAAYGIADGWVFVLFSVTKHESVEAHRILHRTDRLCTMVPFRRTVPTGE
jgi:hypothetical protein